MPLKKIEQGLDLLEIYNEAHINRLEISPNFFAADYYFKYNLVIKFLVSKIELGDQYVDLQDEGTIELIHRIAHKITRLYCKSEIYSLSENSEYHYSDEAKDKFLTFAEECYAVSFSLCFNNLNGELNDGIKR